MKTEPYLTFSGRCEEALNFYVDALGARIDALMRFSDAPPGGMPDCPVEPDKVMHAMITIGDNVVMASDGGSADQAGFSGFALTVTADDAVHAAACFNALSDGGTVTMPLSETFFAHQFGMVNDRFGVPWMVIVPREG